MGAFNTCAAEDGDPFGCIEQDGSRLLTIIGGAHHPWHKSNRPRWAMRLAPFQKDLPWDHHHGRTPALDRRAHGDLKHPR
jgi:hypothetical protein